MTLENDVLSVLDSSLGLKGRALAFTSDTRLLGALPEFDSMAIVALLTAIEDRYGFVIQDDEIDSTKFKTVASLCEFVRLKMAT